MREVAKLASGFTPKLDIGEVSDPSCLRRSVDQPAPEQHPRDAILPQRTEQFRPVVHGSPAKTGRPAISRITEGKHRSLITVLRTRKSQ